MANFRRNPISAQIADDDIDCVLALQAIPDYKPSNSAFGLEALMIGHDQLRQAEKIHLHNENSAAASRDALAKARENLHELVFGMKTQVKAQFGPDSDEVASLGLKKRSERKPPSKAKKAEAEG